MKLKYTKITAIFIIAITVFLSFPFLENLLLYSKYSLLLKDSPKVMLSFANPQVKALTADPSNRLLLKVQVRTSKGNPVASANIHISSNGVGSVYPSKLKTNKYGECFVSYIPPEADSNIFHGKENITVNITASIPLFESSFSKSVILDKVPVVLVHGYLSNANIFDNMKEYVSKKGFETIPFNYKSEDGVAAGAKQLEQFLARKKIEYMAKGIQVQKFDMVAHSMGGLIARYYSGSEAYLNNNDIRKIIFISVPQRGSPLASLGINYFNNEGIKDLSPDNELFTDIFPHMANGGLNSSIQVGSIIGQYDEVVSSESASLKEWNIDTEMFNVGENNLTVDKILNGSFAESANHKLILYNKKVFEKILQMLDSKLPYPSIIK